MSSLLNLRNVLFRRGCFSLRVDQLDINAGQGYLLEGANGVGKSTLLHLLAQLLVPDAGEVLFDNLPVRKDADRQRLRQQITLVEQSPFLFDTSVFDNLAFGLRLRGVHGHELRQSILAVLQKVGLDGFEFRPAKALSGGEVRRVALARALALHPKLLLLDETVTGLDRDAIKLFEEILVGLAQQNVAVVMTCHDELRMERLKMKTLSLTDGLLVNHEESSGV